MTPRILESFDHVRGKMYLDFYGLKEKPFSLTPDPQFLFLSGNHRAAIEYLIYGIEQREGFIVMTGQIGTGKTTICRTVIGRLNPHVKTAVIFNSFLTEEELLESILLDFGQPSEGKSRKERIDLLNQLLIRFLAEGKNAALIIDEAQNLSVPVLEQIRMLSNLETEKEKMLQIVLLGQHELDEKLRSPELKQLNQRIAIRHHLLPLDRRETESYINQRLAVAGANGSISFSKTALNEVYRFSQGTPRLINLLCDRALIGGFVEGTYHIDKSIIKKAERELGGEEWDAPAFRSTSFSKYFPPLRIFLLAVLLFLLAGMILLNHDQSASLRGTRFFIHDQFEKVYLRIAGETRPFLEPNPRNNQTNPAEEMVKTHPEETR